MARTAAELVAALDSGEPSRVLRTPEGRYTTQVLDFCKELWSVDPLAQTPEAQAAIAALPHPSHWEDEAAVRATITQWLSVLSIATNQFTRDPLAWRDKTRPPETHRDRPWINSFSSKSFPDQIPVPFTMGTETWHRSGNTGIRMVAGKDRASLAMYPLPNVRWRVASNVALADYGLKGFQGYGVRSPFVGNPTHQLTLDRLYSHLLYCVMDCPPPGYEPAPTATWEAVPVQNPGTRQSAVIAVWECVTPGTLIEWSGEAPTGSVWARSPNPPVAYKKYSKGDRISWRVLPPSGGWTQRDFSLKITADGEGRTHYYTLPTAQWEAVVQPVLTRADQGEVLKPTLRCTQKGYLWGGWSYAKPTGWQRGRTAREPDSSTLYEVGAEVYLTFQASPVTPDALLTPRSASLSVDGVSATSQYQPALASFRNTVTSREDPARGYLDTSLTAQVSGYLDRDMTWSVPEGWVGGVSKALGKRGDWVESGTVYGVYATRPASGDKSRGATLSLTYGRTSSSSSYLPPWATWEIHGEATKDYTRFTFRCLTEGLTPWVYKSFDPALPPGTTATFELETPLGNNNWAEKDQLGSLRYVFSKPLTQTIKTTIRLGQENGTLIGQEASATFIGEPQLSLKSAFHWLSGGAYSVLGEIQVDSEGVIQSQGWTQSPSNGNVAVVYYPEPGKGGAPTFPLTVKAGSYFTVSCTWLASQEGLAKAFAYRLGTQQWSWTS
jgi:hypothetical protein